MWQAVVDFLCYAGSVYLKVAIITCTLVPYLFFNFYLMNIMRNCEETLRDCIMYAYHIGYFILAAVLTIYLFR